MAATANAGQFKCMETKADAMKKNRNKQYGVLVMSLGRIDNPKVVGEVDYAEAVKVLVLSRDLRDPSAKLKADRPTFRAVAKSEDVMYEIKAWKRNNFRLMIFMDELDQTSMSLRGVKGSIRMNCHSTQLDAS